MNFELAPKTLILDIKNSFLRISNKKLSTIDDYKSALESRYYKVDDNSFEPCDSHSFIKKERYNYLFAPSMKRMSSTMKEITTLKSEFGNWAEINLMNPITSLITKDFVKNYSKSGLNFTRENKVKCPNVGDVEMNKLLQKYFGDDVLIPYKIEDRKKKFPKAFKDLAKHMKKYQ